MLQEKLIGYSYDFVAATGSSAAPNRVLQHKPFQPERNSPSSSAHRPILSSHRRRNPEGTIQDAEGPQTLSRRPDEKNADQSTRPFLFPSPYLSETHAHPDAAMHLSQLSRACLERKRHIPVTAATHSGCTQQKP